METPRPSSNEELRSLKRLISQPKESVVPPSILLKAVWSDNHLQRPDVQILLDHAHEELRQALKAYLATLEGEMAKVQNTLLQGALELSTQRRSNMESIKGDICVLVQRRWTYEELTEQLLGRRPREL